jgi:hypothetical protein
MPFTWKLKPSSAGALLGQNKYKTRDQALAEALRDRKPALFKQIMHCLHVAQTSRESARDAIAESDTLCSAIEHGVRSQTKSGRDEALANIRKEVFSGVQTRSRRQVAKRILDEARSEMYKATGIIQEQRGMDQAAKKQGKTFEDGNKRFYRLDLPGEPYGGVLWGLIDGFDKESGTIIEHKQRQNRFFQNIPAYERIQCFIYMKMLGVHRAQLIQTFDGEQREHMILWDEEEWTTIYTGLVQCIRDLNRALKDTVWCKQLVQSLC